MPDQLVVILGMHRSGTSLVTSSLPLLGFPVGDNLMLGNEDNPRGFFEDLDVVSLNDDLLSVMRDRFCSEIVGQTTTN